MIFVRVVFAILLLGGGGGVQGYQRNAGQPRSYAKGEAVELKVNKMTSRRELFPLDHYRLPFCQPEGGPSPTLEDPHLGALLAGDRVQSSPYRINMYQHVFCEKLCVTDLGEEEGTGITPNPMIKAIRHEYGNNWILDGIPAANRKEDKTTVTMKYWGGSPVGFIPVGSTKSYVYNHLNIEIQYHRVEAEPGKARVVGFYVQPFSMLHIVSEAGDILNPIASCDTSRPGVERPHPNYDMMRARAPPPQPASGKVLFTYDVIWRQNHTLEWSSRWDVYLTMDNIIPDIVYWYSIVNTLFVVMMVSALFVSILVRNLRRHKGLATDEEKAEHIVQFSWALVHADVFRPPRFSPLLLAACCGTGSQIFCSAFLVLLLAFVGVVGSSDHGSFVVAMLYLYGITGLVGGYTTMRFCNIFYATHIHWQKAAACTAMGFPGIAFGVFITVNMLAVSKGSTYASPMNSFYVLLTLWVGMALLVFIGAYAGRGRGASQFPPSTRKTRKIPPQSWLRSRPLSFVCGGIIPFSVFYIYVFSLFGSVWLGFYFNPVRLLLLEFTLSFIVIGVSASLFNYNQLCGENHSDLWWYSFLVGGSISLWVILYSFTFFKQLQASSFATAVLYFGYTWLVALALFLAAGFVGISACLCFNKILFSAMTDGDASSPAELLLASDLASDQAVHLQTRNDQQCSMVKRVLITVVGFAVLLFPALVNPTQSQVAYQYDWNYSNDSNDSNDNNDSNDSNDSNDINWASRESGEKIHHTLSPFSFELVHFSCGLPFFIWIAIIIFTVNLKRRMSSPGGMIYLYNQRKVMKILKERRHILTKILQDQHVTNFMRRKFGNLSSLQTKVCAANGNYQGLQMEKDECVRTRGTIICPWVREMNVGLYSVLLGGLYTHVEYIKIGDPNTTRSMFVSLILVHIIDNMLLYRAFAKKGAARIVECQSLFAAVGIPVIEVA